MVKITSYVTSSLRLLALLTSLFLLTSGANAGALERLFVPAAEAWSFWDTHDEAGGIDHSKWQRFLQDYVRSGDDGVNRVEYATAARDSAALHAYIESLENVDIRRYNRDEQLAYWINLYNAVTIDVVLEHYPVTSISEINISPGWFSFGPWGKKLLQIEGQALSLNDIEHRILRPLWKDSRLHYALNCASIGCPNLQRRAFTADNTQVLLEQAAHDYVNHPRGVTVADGELHVSSIYSWFREDFGNSEVDVIKHLQGYASAELAAALAAYEKINDDDYDWSLNDTKPFKPEPETDDDF